MSASEIWRSVPGHPAYEVSTLGRVRSGVRGSWRELQGGVYAKRGGKSKGYRFVRIAGRCRSVHELVLISFVSARPGRRHQADHINGDTHDNRVWSLRWVSAGE